MRISTSVISAVVVDGQMLRVLPLPIQNKVINKVKIFLAIESVVCFFLHFTLMLALAEACQLF